MPVTYTPDLTGLSPDYYVEDYIRMVIKDPQKLVFQIGVPVHDNVNLEIFDISAVPVLLIKDTDWEIQADDIDNDAMAEMRAADPLFVGTLLKSVTIIKAYAADFPVLLKYNQLYPNTINFTDMDPDVHIEWTPSLLAYMVKTIEYLKEIIWNKPSVYTDQSDDISIKPEDINAESADNDIVAEVHDVNYQSDVIYLHPIYGAFFKDSLVVRNKNTQVVYIEDTDYEIIEPNIDKTLRTANPSGVFDGIRIDVELIGEVEIDYHAFGGTVDISTMVSIRDKVLSMVYHLQSGYFLTSAILRADTSFTTIFDELARLSGLLGVTSPGKVRFDHGILGVTDIDISAKRSHQTMVQTGSQNWTITDMDSQYPEFEFWLEVSGGTFGTTITNGTVLPVSEHDMTALVAGEYHIKVFDFGRGIKLLCTRMDA